MKMNKVRIEQPSKLKTVKTVRFGTDRCEQTSSFWHCNIALLSCFHDGGGGVRVLRLTNS